MNSQKIAAACVLQSFIMSQVYAQWAETNMGFESGTTGWTIGAGDTGTMTTTITGSGTGVSLITGSPGTVTFNSSARNAYGTPGSVYYQPAVSAATWQFRAYENQMLALQPRANTNWSTVGAELGLSSSQITSLSTLLQQQAVASTYGSGSITNLAYVYRTVNLTAGTTYRFAWNYIGTDYVPYNDGSITTLVPTGSTTGVTTVNNYIQNYALLGFTNPGTGDYSAGTFGSTGWQVSTYSVDTSGSYQLGFAVFNLDDTALSPVLLIDNLQGTTTRNGVTFGAVAPNAGTSAPSSSSPTLVSSAAGTPTVTTSTSYGTTSVTENVTIGDTITVVTITDTRTGVSKVLSVNRNTNTVSTTPITTTTTSTTPITTTTTTTPVTINTYSDGSTQSVNGTPIVSSSVSNQITVTSNVVNDVLTSNQNQSYSTRIDQYDYLFKSNQRINSNIDSNILDRHKSIGSALQSKLNTVGNDEDGWFYLIADNQRSNVSDTYRLNTTRFGVGHEKKIQNDWMVGFQYNNINSSLSGQQSGGKLEKHHFGIYSLYVSDDWLLKSDIGLSTNSFHNHHSIDELNMSNSSKSRGTDFWISNRLYTPDIVGFRAFSGIRIQNLYVREVSESGTAITAITHNRFQQSNTITDLGFRYENVIASNINLMLEAWRTTDNVNNIKLGIGTSIHNNIFGNIYTFQQKYSDITNKGIQASIKWSF